MANSPATITEVRFKFEPELTRVYIFHACPDFWPAHGWRTKTFPASRKAVEILQDDIAGSLAWDTGAP